jgi:hypothetical protein
MCFLKFTYLIREQQKKDCSETGQKEGRRSTPGSTDEVQEGTMDDGIHEIAVTDNQFQGTCSTMFFGYLLMIRLM